MTNIPIFDCLTHPTLNNNWLHPAYDGNANIDKLIIEMKKNNIEFAFAVGMKNIGEYKIDKYVDFITNKSKNLYPIAFFDFEKIKSKADIIPYLNDIKSFGYYGIKIHPRFSKINFTNEYLDTIILNSNKLDLIPMICTYFSDIELNCRNNLIELMMLLKKVPNEKLILIHSGVVNLLELINMAKIFPNVLFDLSYTMCKYNGSSLDMDIQFLFNNFDRRICIGSDHPEVSLKELRYKFEFFAKNLSIDKAENIAYKNLKQLVVK